MVRVVGIEPTLLSEPDFESGASTSSTTPASIATTGWKICKTDWNCSGSGEGYTQQQSSGQSSSA